MICKYLNVLIPIKHLYYIMYSVILERITTYQLMESEHSSLLMDFEQDWQINNVIWSHILFLFIQISALLKSVF